MRRLKPRHALPATVLYLAVASGLAATPARAGQEGHGGDPLAAEFVATGWDILSQLAQAPAADPALTEADLARLQDALQTTRVDAVDTLLTDHIGDDVDARVIEDPLRFDAKRGVHPYVIQINRAAMYRWLKQGELMHRLVLHEYLWVIGKDDENYRLSGRLRFDALHAAMTAAARGQSQAQDCPGGQ